MTENKSLNLELKELSAEGLFSAYASIFDNVDYENDTVIKGAFTKSIAEKTPVMLWNHNTAEPIGIWTTVKEDDKGLYVEGKLLINEVARAKEVYSLLKEGAVSGLSIGYSVNDYSYDEKGIRQLKDVTLHEISLVSIPCNDEARIISVKSIDDLTTLKDVEKYLKSRGLSNKEALTVISSVKKIALPLAESKLNKKNLIDSINKNILKLASVIRK